LFLIEYHDSFPPRLDGLHGSLSIGLSLLILATQDTMCVGNSGEKKLFFELLPVSEGKISRWSQVYLQSLAPTNPRWARVVGYGYGPFSFDGRLTV
jgi:hypothetical protein